MEVSGVPHYCLWITRHSNRPVDEIVEKVEEEDAVPPRRPDCLTTLPPPPALTTTNPSPLTESTDVSLGHVSRYYSLLISILLFYLFCIFLASNLLVY